MINPIIPNERKSDIMGTRLNSTPNDRPLSLRSRILIGITLSILVILLFATDKGEPAMGATIRPNACEEDEACWDCETMGNQICGPEPTDIAPATPIRSTARFTG